MNVAAGFEDGLSFYYSNPNGDNSIFVWSGPSGPSGPSGTGGLLTTLFLFDQVGTTGLVPALAW